MNDCVQCNKCSAWVHFDCAELTPTDIEFYNVYENAFFCRERCKMAPLVCPPHLTKIRKSNNCVTADNCAKESTLNPTAPPFFPASSKTKKTTLDLRSKIAKSYESVYYHKFLEIKCSYLYPNNLDNSFLSRDNSEFVIFHNNVNSLCDIESDTMGKVKDIFQNCSSLPDLLAFSDTRVNENSLIPPLNGYHDFHFTPTPTGAGGVGFYL